MLVTTYVCVPRIYVCLVFVCVNLQEFVSSGQTARRILRTMIGLMTQPLCSIGSDRKRESSTISPVHVDSLSAH
jgi:hypothetical protein